MQRRAGPKGFGLYADEDVPAGQFLIEYIGEVLEEEEYMRRKQYYIQTGQRHYYFMNIGNGEVIDACRKVCMSAATVGPPYQQTAAGPMRTMSSSSNCSCAASHQAGSLLNDSSVCMYCKLQCCGNHRQHFGDTPKLGRRVPCRLLGI